MTESLISRLTERERECMRGVAGHKRSKEIAVELGLKEKTVDAYIAGAVRKLGFFDRDTAIRALIAEDPRAWGFSPPAKTGVEPRPKPSFLGSVGRLPWPFPTPERPHNDLGTLSTVAAILVAASMLVAGFSLFMMLIFMLTR